MAGPRSSLFFPKMARQSATFQVATSAPKNFRLVFFRVNKKKCPNPNILRPVEDFPVESLAFNLSSSTNERYRFENTNRLL